MAEHKHEAAAEAAPDGTAARKALVMQQVMSPKALGSTRIAPEKLLGRVPLLQGPANWTDWKNRIEIIMKAERLYEPFITVCKSLHPHTLADVLNTITEEDMALFAPDEDDEALNGKWKEFTTKRDTYEQAEMSMHSLLFNALSPQVCVHLRDVPHGHPYQLWRKLMSLYERETATSTRERMTKFLQMRMQDDENAETYYTRVLTTAMELRARKKDITEEQIVDVIYAGLPKTFLPIKLVLEQNDGLSADDIIERLRDFEEQHQRHRAGQDDVFSVQHSQQRGQDACRNFMKGRCLRGDNCHYEHAKLPSSVQGAAFRGGAPQSSYQQTRDCFNCGRPGHISRDCRQQPTTCNKCGRRGHHSRFCRGGGMESSKATDNAAVATTSDDDHFVFMVDADNNKGGDAWIVDSGATRHMTKDAAGLRNVRNTTTQLHLADGTTRTIDKVGDLDLEGGIELRNVLYAPMLKKNLLSTVALDDEGFKVEQKSGKMYIYNANGQQAASATRQGRLFVLDNGNHDNANAATATSNTELWHRRMGHISVTQLRAAVSACNGIDNIDHSGNHICEGCALGKMARKPTPQEADNRSTTPGERICTDLQGPMETPGSGGARYSMNFVDEATGMTKLYFLTHKSNAAKAAETFLNMVKTQGKTVKYLRSDGGGEYTGDDFGTILRQHGVGHETTNPDSPNQNGKAERNNRTIMEMARCLLKTSGMPNKFWCEAMKMAEWIHNRAPSRTIGGKTAHEAWTGQKPNVEHLRVFGSLGYVHVPKKDRSKLDPKAKICFLTGVGNSGRKYQVWSPDDGRFIMTADVRFNEQVTYKNYYDKPQRGALDTSMNDDSDDEIESKDSITTKDGRNEQHNDAAVPAMPAVQEQQQEEQVPVAVAQQQEQEQAPAAVVQQPRRSARDNKGVPTRVRLGDEAGAHLISDNNADEPEWCLVTINEEPRSYNEAVASDEQEEWRGAMQRELNSLKENDTYTLTELPEGRRAIRCKWVFKCKVDEQGDTTRFKARLVAMGFSQAEGLDYNETFAPVANYKSVRLLLALATQFNLTLTQYDIETAFLNGKLTEEIYMQQPPGFAEPGQENKVWRLERALYGLKQASRVWHLDLSDTLVNDFKFKSCETDPCVYIYRKDESVAIMAVVVDDLIFADNDPQLRQRLESVLKHKYKTTCLGQLKWCLQMHVQRDAAAGTLKLDQRLLTDKILQRFQMNDCKPAATPMEVGALHSKTLEDANDKNQESDNDDKNEESNTLYKSAVGALQYLALNTRPDIAFAVNVVSRFAAKPARHHWQAVKRIMRYLAGTRDTGIIYKRTGNDGDGRPLLHGYADADWGGDTETRRSTTGYAFVVANGPVSWRSKLQHTVALSTAEAEYLAAGDAAQEALWLRATLAELGFAQEGATVIFEDNQGCIAMTINSGQHQRTKHIDIRHHFLKQLVSDNKVLLSYLPTDAMLADIFTKPLAKPRFTALRDSLLGCTAPPSSGSVGAALVWR